MYVDVITKFFWMEVYQIFLVMGLRSRVLCALRGSAMTYSVQLILYLVPLYFHFVL